MSFCCLTNRYLSNSKMTSISYNYNTNYTTKWKHALPLYDVAIKTTMHTLEYAASAWDPHTINMSDNLKWYSAELLGGPWTTSQPPQVWPTCSTSLVGRHWSTGGPVPDCHYSTVSFMDTWQPTSQSILCSPPDWFELPTPLSFRQIQTSKDFYKYSFFPLAVVQWNLLQQHVVELRKPVAFKASVANIQHPRP